MIKYLGVNSIDRFYSDGHHAFGCGASAKNKSTLIFGNQNLRKAFHTNNISKKVMSNNKEIPFQALIFDMDGTMIDNMMIHHRAWQRKLASLGLELTLEEVRRDIHGVNEEIIERLFGDRFDTEEIKQIAWEKEEEYRKIYAGEVALLPGLEVFLDKAKALEIPMGIGTAAPEGNVSFIMEALDLQRYFEIVVHSGMVSRGKPDPEVFEQVANQFVPCREGWRAKALCQIGQSLTGGRVRLRQAVNQNCTVIDPIQIEQSTNQSSLAGTVDADQSDRLATRDGERHVRQNWAFTK